MTEYQGTILLQADSPRVQVDYSGDLVQATRIYIKGDGLPADVTRSKGYRLKHMMNLNDGRVACLFKLKYAAKEYQFTNCTFTLQ